MKVGKAMQRIAGAVAAGLLSVAVMALWVPQNADAKVSAEQMLVDVALQQDGSAIITQNWTSYSDEGTEYYLYFKDSGFLEFSDFHVKDDTCEYTDIGAWDVDASFDEKAYKSGIHKVDDGVELCWGISRKGANHYTFSYKLDNLIGSYDDYDGCLYRFVNTMDFFPTDVVVTIRMADGTPLNESNAAIWAFQYEGVIDFENGAVVAKTGEPLEGDQSMVIMLRLDKSVMDPVYTWDKKFQDVIDGALEDSDYLSEYLGDETDDGLWWIPLALFGGVFGVSVIWSTVVNVKNRRWLIELESTSSVYYDMPLGGNLNAAYVLGKCLKICNEGSILGAGILRLLQKGVLEALPIAGSTTGEANLRLHPEKLDGDPMDADLLAILQGAAGADMLVSSHAIKTYGEKHYTELQKYFTHCVSDGMAYLKTAGYLKKKNCSMVRDLTEQGIDQAKRMFGLKKYLGGYADLQPLNPSGNDIWQELLNYAILFGMVKDFEMQVKEYHRNVGRYDYESDSYYYFMYGGYSHNYYSTMHKAMTAGAARASGGGGSSSGGGGGGSAGGGGGGCR